MCMVGVAQLVEHLVVVQVAAGSSPVTHPTAWPAETQARHFSSPHPSPSRETALRPASRCPTMGRMLMGKKRTQRITVGVILGVMVLSLALSLISSGTGF